MVEPAYQELLDKDIPRKTEGGVTVKVIAGESLGVKVNILLTSSQKQLKVKHSEFYRVELKTYHHITCSNKLRKVGRKMVGIVEVLEV